VRKLGKSDFAIAALVSGARWIFTVKTVFGQSRRLVYRISARCIAPAQVRRNKLRAFCMLRRSEKIRWAVSAAMDRRPIGIYQRRDSQMCIRHLPMGRSDNGK
jgi:hypothetical protein